MVTDIEKAKRAMKRRHLAKRERDILHSSLSDTINGVERSAVSIDISDIISKYIQVNNTYEG